MDWTNSVIIACTFCGVIILVVGLGMNALDRTGDHSTQRGAFREAFVDNDDE